MEQVIVNIPENIAAVLRSAGAETLERRALELFAIGAYETNTITGRQVMDMLGFQTREELYQFFKVNDVKDDYTIEDLETDAAALEALLNR
jgi:Uncharacterised protein family (UPF0175)